MTEQERQQEFVKAMQELEQRFGVTITAITIAEKHGEMITVKPQLQVALVPDWQPKESA